MSSFRQINIMKSRTMRWAGHVVSMCGWEDHITMDLKEVRWEGVKSINLVQFWEKGRALVNTAINFIISYKVGNLLIG